MSGQQEKLKYCPDCMEDEGIKSTIKRYRLNDEIYTILCDKCLFQQTHTGIPSLNPEFLAMAGLPEELVDYMEVYCEDVDKIVRFAAHDFFLKYCFQSDSVNINLIEICMNRIFENIHNQARIQNCESVSNGIAEALLEAKTAFETETSEFSHGRAEALLEVKTAFETETSDIDAQYKKNIVEILKNIDNFTYPDDIFRPNE